MEAGRVGGSASNIHLLAFLFQRFDQSKQFVLHLVVQLVKSFKISGGNNFDCLQPNRAGQRFRRRTFGDAEVVIFSREAPAF